MIRICVTLNEGQSPYNLNTTHVEAITVPSLMMTSTVSEESLVRDINTDFGLVYINLFNKSSPDIIVMVSWT